MRTSVFGEQYMDIDSIDNYAEKKKFEWSRWSIYELAEWNDTNECWEDRREREIEIRDVDEIFNEKHGLKQDTIMCSWYVKGELKKHYWTIEGDTWYGIWLTCERLGEMIGSQIFIEKLFINKDGELEMNYGT